MSPTYSNKNVLIETDELLHLHMYVYTYIAIAIRSYKL